MDLLFATSYSWPLLLIRVFLGIVMFAHGAQKLFGWFGGHGLKGTNEHMKNALGISPFFATLTALVETFGGLALILGVFSRLAALGVIIVQAAAIAKVHKGNGFFINWAMAEGKGHGWEMSFVLLGMALTILLSGGGLMSIDLAILY